MATKGDELYFQDLPMYDKLISLQQKGGGGGWETALEPQNVAREQVGREVAALA